MPRPVGHIPSHHDEVDLGRLSDSKREEAFAAFGPDKDMQLSDQGLRRRLAPMFDADQRRAADGVRPAVLDAGHAGRPHGDEIGRVRTGVNLGRPSSLQDNPRIGDVPLPPRGVLAIGKAVWEIVERAPMQWSDAPERGLLRSLTRRLGLSGGLRAGAFVFGLVWRSVPRARGTRKRPRVRTAAMSERRNWMDEQAEGCDYGGANGATRGTGAHRRAMMCPWQSATSSAPTCSRAAPTR